MVNVAARRAPRAAVERLGGTAGNETLTSATALILTLLLIAEGITIILIGSMRDEHMFIGMVLIPPLLLKLGSTGYRFARYYLEPGAYRDKGPPQLVLRLLAPVLVVNTVLVFASGVALLVVGHRPSLLFNVHKISFIVWGVCFAVHFLAHLPRMTRSVRRDWTREGRGRITGSGVRLALLLAAGGGGVALALAVLPLITGWHGHHGD